MKTHINGFQINIYNQYNLKEGAHYSRCPKCSTGRRKSNDKCASLDWDRGIGTCHHCGDVFQLHTYSKKKDLKDYYAYNENGDGTITYFHHDGSETKE